MEKAYEEISVDECKKMLDVDGPGLTRLVQEREWHHDKLSGVIRFISDEERRQTQTLEIPAKELAEMAISYAKEMEQIV